MKMKNNGIDNNELKSIEDLEREGYVPVYANGDKKIVYFVKCFRRNAPKIYRKPGIER